MAFSPTQDDRYRRLQQQAADWGVGSLPPLRLDARPPASPLSSTVRTANDDFMAEELLKRHRLNAVQDNSQTGLRRAFTTSKKKSYDPKEIYHALDAHVGNCGSPGIAEALIFKLISTGGNLTTPTTNKRSSLLNRRKSMERMEPTRILQKAVENCQTDMVSVLVQHADHFALDSALPIAIRSGNLVIVELLLRYGANASQTADGQDAFRQACITGGQSDLIGLILQSDGRPSQSWVSECMIDATRKGCLDSVLRLSRSTADGNYHDAAALKHAIAQCRVDIALAILTGSKPPTGRGLDEAFGDLFGNNSILPNEKMALTQALLCAGASGDVVSAALVQACEIEFYEMVDLLVSHGASVEYQDAIVLRKAVSKGRSSLISLLLTERTSLSRTYASECVEYIPKNIAFEDRHAFLSTLLRKGAAGPPIDKALVDAVKAGDIESAKLLLTPHFPGGRVATGNNPSQSPRGMVYDRHNTASVDHRGGEALRLAIISNSVPMVKILLNVKPSPDTLARVFPQIRDLSPVVRCQMAELFLSTGLTGPCVSAALQEAIEVKPPQRDERFISLLLSYNADVNFNDGAGILSAIAHEDIHLLERLLKNRPSLQIAATGISKAMVIVDRSTRYKTVSLLIGVGLGQQSTKEVSEAMVYVLQSKLLDSKLLSLLLEHGKADVNFMHGSPIIHAARVPDPAVLEYVLQKGSPSPETLTHGLDAVSELPPSPAKTAKVESMLRRTKHKESLDAVLVKEVQTAIKGAPEQRTLAIIQSLLAAGADVNAQQAAALRCAVSAGDAAVSDLLFDAHPNPASLAAALPYALNISDLMDRLAFTKKLIEAGAPDVEANRALVHAITTYPDDISLIRILASRADLRDGDALVAAIRKERVEIVEILLVDGRKRYAPATLNTIFVDTATKVVDKPKRVIICTLLLEAGVSGPAVSDALLAAAADGDTALGAALLQKGGASVDHRDGKAVLEACRAGAVEVLAMLLNSPSEIKKQTLAQGFQSATQVGDLKKRAEVFRLLLEKGVTGEVVDAQLVSAARFGHDGRPLVKLLLEFGADPNYNNGEAVWTATRSAILGSLALMLGVAGVGERQKKPSSSTVAKALKASWMLSKEPRYQVIEWVFAAGQPLTEEQIDTMLVKTVKREPDLRLIKLLLAKGASPLTNGGQSLIDATQSLHLDILAVFLEADIPGKDLAWAFSQAFTPASADVWLSDKGYDAAKMLLDKGARGDGVAVALGTATDAYGSEKDTIARRFVELLINCDVDVDINDGLMLQKAAARADSELLRQMLSRKPNTRTVSMAFPYIFQADLGEDELLVLIGLFTEYHNGEERLDVMFVHPQCQSVLFTAVQQFPRSAKVLQALLDAGFYQDQMIMGRVMPDDIEEEEQLSLLLWALLQPQKRVSDSVIELLISRGANVNFESRLSKATPLMLAVQSKRKDLVRKIILAGAEVDVVDATGNTPLTMATRIGGDIGTTMMTNILAAEPSRNDGSLHNAARELNLRAVDVLAEFGHELDFPSPIHDGRSALGEMCLNAAHAGPLTASQEKQMEKVMAYLIDHGADLTVHSHKKSILLLALESADPIPTTRALLKVGMWKHTNATFNNYTDGKFVYSPTQYISRVLPQRDTSPALLSLLYANRAQDTYYALSGPQPPDAANLPDAIRLAEHDRLARLSRLAAEEEDHRLLLSRAQETATLQEQILVRRSELQEAAARRSTHLLRDRGAVEDELFAAQLRRQKADRDAQLRFEAEMAQVGARKVRMLGDAEMEVLAGKQRAVLEFERQIGGERVRDAREMSAVRVREREEIDRIDGVNAKRIVGRIEAQRKLVEKQDGLAARFVAAGVNPRQIGGGYIAGELD